MIKTEFYYDFLEYYKKAKILQDRNTGILPPDTKSGDPIMDNVTIYDTVNRKYAGFSKALEDIHGVRCKTHHKKYKDFSTQLDIREFHILHLFHRFTGSGASFRPIFDDNGVRRADEHGYYNNKVEMYADLIQHEGLSKATTIMTQYKDPMVTSIGNQPPSLKNKMPDKYRLAMQYYFDNFAIDFVDAYLAMLIHRVNPCTIKEAVDFCCKWHKIRGFKQWHFVLTAFVMDTAEYYPQYIDVNSHCYYGANCSKSFKLMFEKEKSDKMKKAQWDEYCMEKLVEECSTSKPYDLEDVACDYIRYIKEYIPKGYSDLPYELTKNNSSLKTNGEYPILIKSRIKEVLK